MNKTERKKWKKLREKKVKIRVPVAPPSKRHRTKKDYRRKKKVDVDE